MLNPGIRKLVHLLNEHGFETTDSGDGETSDCDCDRENAYVCVLVKPDRLIDNCAAIKALLKTYGVTVKSLDEDGTVPNVQGTFDACWDTAVIDIINVTDAMLSNGTN